MIFPHNSLIASNETLRIAMNETQMKKEFTEGLSQIIRKIDGQALCVDLLKSFYQQAFVFTNTLNDFAKEIKIWDPQNCKGWSPMRDWKEMSGEVEREIKYLRTEVYPLFKFFNQKQPTATIKSFNDNRNYDAELLDVDGNVTNYVEITFPIDGQFEKKTEKKITKQGYWSSEFSDDQVSFFHDYCNGDLVKELIKKKSEKNYPKNTILIIMAGPHFPHCDDFDSEKPNQTVEKYWNKFAEEASSIENSFTEIWLIDIREPYTIRAIK